MRGDSAVPACCRRSPYLGACGWRLLACAWVLVGIGALRAQPPAASKSVPALASAPRKSSPGAEAIAGGASAAADAEEGELRREGTQLRDERGHFELNGTRVIFASADKKTRFVGLENLNLQRISQIMGSDFDQVEWIVSGLVTEYQGANYLLVTRAAKATSGSGRRRSF